MKRIPYYKWRGERVVGLMQRIISLWILGNTMVLAGTSLLYLFLLLPVFLMLWRWDEKQLYRGEVKAATEENEIIMEMRDILKRLEGK